jgi:hypothetical protein
MDKLHLKTLVINADTIAVARLNGIDLWKQANDNPHMIFLAPEQLLSKEFSNLVKDDGMLMLRTCIFAVDKAHLLNMWGTGFHKAYQQTGWVCSHLRNVVLLGLSATMCGGAHIQSVLLPPNMEIECMTRGSNAIPGSEVWFRWSIIPRIGLDSAGEAQDNHFLPYHQPWLPSFCLPVLSGTLNGSCHRSQQVFSSLQCPQLAVIQPGNPGVDGE